MTTNDLAHLDWLARVDALQAQLATWASQPIDWEPLRPAQALVQRLLDRAEPLRCRWEAPLVVATFGGTGTGKSSLVNALVGEEVAKAGKERPTTRRPTLLLHPDVDPSACPIPLDCVDVVRRDLPLLRDVLLLDCPDPDTSETDAEETNLGRLHELLPYCDVLLYVSTQQKYRSAKVGDELGKAAESCRLVFVQTHADTDADIRDDWRAQLEPYYRIAEMFFVDSRQALAEQQQELHPTGEFARLLTFLSRELAASRRAGIRRANLLELLDQGLSRSVQLVEPALPKLDELNAAILEQRRRLGQSTAQRFAAELEACRGLWERRLLGQVTGSWGASPFAGLLRLHQAQAMLVASWSLFRARSAAQLALWGAWQGARWFGERQSSQSEDERIRRLSELGLDPAELRAAEFILTGHARAAELNAPRSQEPEASAGAAFLAEATQKLDRLIERAAARNTGRLTRFCYETLFLLFPGFLIYRIGRNYFYDSFWLDKPLLDLSFYVPSLIFLLIWCGAFLWRFLARLRRGVLAEIRTLSTQLAESPAWDELFGDFSRCVARARDQFAQLQRLRSSVAALRQSLAEEDRLGGRRTPVRSTYGIETGTGS